jgi:hypothetical protein
MLISELTLKPESMLSVIRAINFCCCHCKFTTNDSNLFDAHCRTVDHIEAIKLIDRKNSTRAVPPVVPIRETQKLARTNYNWSSRDGCWTYSQTRTVFQK